MHRLTHIIVYTVVYPGIFQCQRLNSDAKTRNVVPQEGHKGSSERQFRRGVQLGWFLLLFTKGLNC